MKFKDFLPGRLFAVCEHREQTSARIPKGEVSEDAQGGAAAISELRPPWGGYNGNRS